MKIAISGASGFIGTHLSKAFSELGHTIVVIGRSSLESDNADFLAKSISNCDVVINLAGATINHRWSKAYKTKLYSSRIDTTKRIVEAINSIEHKPQLLISASAVGYYPSQGCFDEYSSVMGEGFLANLCDAWEKESQKVSPQVRLVNTRFGVVLAPDGGAYSKMIMPAKLGVATILGRGNQPFPWIDIEDLARAMLHIIQTADIVGAANLVAPTQLSNKDFNKIIAKHNHSLLTIRIPAPIIRLAMGESSEFITQGQCVKPTKLLESGFVFNSKSIDDFLVSTEKVR